MQNLSLTNQQNENPFPDFELKYNGSDSLEEDLGEDVVFFNYEVTYRKDPDMEPFEIIIPAHKIFELIEESDAKLHQYIQSIRNNIPDWGPAESKVIAELEESRVDLKPWHFRFMQKYDLPINEYQRWKKLRSDPSCSEKAKNILKDLDTSARGLKEYNIGYNKLAKILTKVITQETVDLFPVITNSKSEHIKELEDIVIEHVSELTADIMKLVNEAKQE